MRNLLLDSCIQAEIHSSVDHHENARDHEASIKSSNPISMIGFLHAVKNAVKLPDLPKFSKMYIVGEACACVIERIDKELSGSPCKASTFHVVENCRYEVCIFFVCFIKLKGAHIEIFEGKVEGLCWEVS